MNSILGPAAGGIISLIFRNRIVKDLDRKPFDFSEESFDPLSIMNGILAGLVAVTGNCAFT